MKLITISLLTLAIGCITGCAEIKPTTAHYGHGVYHCYFKNQRTRQFFLASDDTEKEASRVARHECRLQEADHQDSVNCRFVDCVFK